MHHDFRPSDCCATAESTFASTSIREGEDVPPVVACASCGSAACDGRCTTVPPKEAKEALLPWESGDSPALYSLFETARATAVAPEHSFGRLAQGSLKQAFWFAFLCELLALFSLFAVGVGGAALLFWRLAVQLLVDPRAWGVLLFALPLLSLIMVALHAIWGLVLERSVGGVGRSTDANRGLRFGLYACGWDLLTSPLGLFASVLAHGPEGLWVPIAAARVPRRAMHSYLETCRGLTPTERAAALAHSARFALVSFACLGFGCLSLLVYWVSHTLWQ